MQNRKFDIKKAGFMRTASIFSNIQLSNSRIRQTAASGSHFSKMLTPEEEKIMREIIREFMV